MKHVLEDDEDCIAVFKDGSSSGNPGATGAAAVVYEWYRERHLFKWT